MCSAACFRVRCIGTGVNRYAENVKQSEGASGMPPNGHASSTKLEFFETSSIEVEHQIMLFNVGVADE